MLSDIFEHIDEKQAAEYLDEMDIKKAAAILVRYGNGCCGGCSAYDIQGKKTGS